jgi:hypothetical protein
VDYINSSFLKLLSYQVQRYQVFYSIAQPTLLDTEFPIFWPRSMVNNRAVASMYSLGGVGQKFPNVCYPENEDARRRRSSCLLGGAENEGRRPEEIFKFRVSEVPFPGLWGRFDRILMVRKKRFSMSKFTICLQFSSTKCAND